MAGFEGFFMVVLERETVTGFGSVEARFFSLASMSLLDFICYTLLFYLESFDSPFFEVYSLGFYAFYP